MTAHSKLLAQLERESTVALLKIDMQWRELRAGLVDKYGEDGVQKVERKIEEDWKAEIKEKSGKHW
jgi:hypothetical protein